MKHLVSMGELLIDFIPIEKSKRLEDVKQFTKMAGGAPANVCACYAKLGGEAYFMGQVGDDPFGHFLKDMIESHHVKTEDLIFTKKAKTALAFVSIDEEGERDFMFYRDPSADQLYEPNQINYKRLDQALFHFCSVGLKEYPLKKAHIEAIKYVKKHQGFISFDPNLRFSLWEDHIELKETVLSFIPHANLIKVTEEELEFLTGLSDVYEAAHALFMGSVSLVIVTEGSKGASLFTRSSKHFIPAFRVDTVDTTGAGDAFIGAFLYQLMKYGNFTVDYEEALRFAQATAALVVSKKGAMESLPTLHEVKRFLDQHDQKEVI